MNYFLSFCYLFDQQQQTRLQSYLQINANAATTTIMTTRLEIEFTIPTYYNNLCIKFPFNNDFLFRFARTSNFLDDEIRFSIVIRKYWRKIASFYFIIKNIYHSAWMRWFYNNITTRTILWDDLVTTTFYVIFLLWCEVEK